MTKHFSDKELTCKCGCGRMKMDPGFMNKVEDLRVAIGRALVPTSAYRCPEYNAKISRTGASGPHTTGKAIDIAICGEDAYKLVKLAMDFGFSGIGISQRGAHNGRFIHLDDLSFPDYPRPRIWSY